jgi:hypothetical protein
MVAFLRATMTNTEATGMAVLFYAQPTYISSGSSPIHLKFSQHQQMLPGLMKSAIGLHPAGLGQLRTLDLGPRLWETMSHWLMRLSSIYILLYPVGQAWLDSCI